MTYPSFVFSNSTFLGLSDIQWTALEALGTTFTAFIALVAIFIALIPFISDWCNRPKLSIKIASENMVFSGEITDNWTPTKSYFFLFNNNGNNVAKNVRYKITSLKSISTGSAVDYVSFSNEHMFRGIVKDIAGNDFTPIEILSHQTGADKFTVSFANRIFVRLGNFELVFIVTCDNHPTFEKRYKIVYNNDEKQIKEVLERT